jgi:flagellar biosynthesis/type III secretory pathway chaperone
MRLDADVHRVAEAILEDESTYVTNDADRSAFATFLYEAGLRRRLVEYIENLNLNEMALPWPALALLLKDSQFDMSGDLEETVWRAAEQSDGTTALLRTSALTGRLQQFERRRSAWFTRELLEVAERKGRLRDQLNYLRSNRMHEQEARILDEIQAIFPEDPEFASERKELEVRMARETLQELLPEKTDLIAELEAKASAFSEDEKGALAAMRKRSREMALVHRNTEMVRDLAVGLHLLEDHSEAARLLEEMDEGRQFPWHRLEFLLRARQFARVLDECAQVELERADQPETILAVTYARCRALWGLGSRALAIELLQSLVRLRPSYRSAQSLLQEWTQGRDEP